MTNSFKDLIGNVSKLESDKSSDFYTKKQLKKQITSFSDDFQQSDISYANFDILPDDFLEYQSNGVQNSTMKKLEKGDINIYESIDLHGMSLLEAEIYTSNTIDSFNYKHMACLRIVHGKGYHNNTDSNPPKIKNFIAQYLANHNRVLAYTSCPVNRGGAGALYVLIRAVK